MVSCSPVLCSAIDSRLMGPATRRRTLLPSALLKRYASEIYLYGRQAMSVPAICYMVMVD